MSWVCHNTSISYWVTPNLQAVMFQHDCHEGLTVSVDNLTVSDGIVKACL